MSRLHILTIETDQLTPEAIVSAIGTAFHGAGSPIHRMPALPPPAAAAPLAVLEGLKELAAPDPEPVLSRKGGRRKGALKKNAKAVDDIEPPADGTMPDRVLTVLRKAPRTPADLARVLGVTMASIYAVTHVMKAKGLIESKFDDGNGTGNSDGLRKWFPVK